MVTEFGAEAIFRLLIDVSVSNPMIRTEKAGKDHQEYGLPDVEPHTSFGPSFHRFMPSSCTKRSILDAVNEYFLFTDKHK